MKYRPVGILFSFLATLNLSAASREGITEKKRPMDGYIIFGQSNSNGRSYRSELSNEALRYNFGSEGNAFLYAYRERSYQNGTQPEDVPLGVMQPDSRERIGAEVTLGRFLAAKSPRPVLLAKFCSGGTSIINFLPEENNLFEPMVHYLKAQQKKAEDEFGYTAKWKGAFVMTGESDSSTKSAPEFRERFLVVQAALEKALNLKELPIVYSLLRGDWVDTPSSNYSRLNESAAFINAAMSDLAKTDSSVRVTPSNSDLKTRFENGDSKGDGIHYCSDSYARLGVRLYQTAAIESASIIDLNANGSSDILEAKFPSSDHASPQAQQEKQESEQSVDSDNDGLSDWAENQLSGFDPKTGDSFKVGEPFSDLPTLLSLLEGTGGRSSEISIEWEIDSLVKTTGRLGKTLVTWNGPQHESTASADAVVTANNHGKKPIEHTVTFDTPQNLLTLTIWGIANGNRVHFDCPFSIINNPNEATKTAQTIIGNPEVNTQVTIRFEEPVSQLTVTAQGDDATFFRFHTEVKLPGKTLHWRD